MLMKRSVDKGGGAFTEPQPGDIALYCMRWSAPICGNRLLPSVSPNPAPVAPPGPHPAVAPPLAPGLDPVRSTATYRYFVVTCDQLPADAVTPAQVEGNALPDEPPQECARAPVGVLFRVLRDDGTAEAVLTDENGEFAFQKPDGVGAEVRMPGGAKDTFPPLVGYQPADPVQRIPATDPDCPSGTAAACKRSYVLVPSSR